MKRIVLIFAFLVFPIFSVQAATEVGPFPSGGSDNHADMNGLANDDHPQYMLESNIGTGANNYLQLDGNGDLPFSIGVDTTNFDGLFSNTTDYDEMQELFDYLDENAGSGAVDPNQQTGTTYTFTASDKGAPVTAKNGSASVYTLRDEASWWTNFSNIGVGTVALHTPTPTGVITLDGTALDAGDEVDVPTAASTRVIRSGAGTWDIISLNGAVADGGAGSYTPNLASATIPTGGGTIDLVYDISTTAGAGGNGGFNLDCTTAGTDITMTYSSGDPGTNWTYTLGSTVNSGDTCNLDYTQPGDGIEASVGLVDLADITDGSVDNQSTAGGSYATTIFSYNFDVSNGSDPTAVGAPTDTWTSETDPNSEGTITSNEYAITVNDVDSIRLQRDFTAQSDLQISFDTSVSTLSLFSDTTRYYNFVDVRYSGGSLITFKISESSTSIDEIEVTYEDDAGQQSTTAAASWVAGTDHTIVIERTYSTGVDAADGSLVVKFDGSTLVNLTNIDDDTVNDMDEVRVGALYTPDSAPSGTLTLDNFTIKTP